MKRFLCLLLIAVFSSATYGQIVSKENTKLRVALDKIQGALASRADYYDLELGEEAWFHIRIVENNVLGEEVKKENPGLKTFDIIEEGKILGAFTYFPGGIWASYTKMGKIITIDPDFKGVLGDHILEYGKKVVPFGMCKTEHDGERYDLADLSKIIKTRGDLVTKLEYRIAIVATGEYYVNNGNSAAAVNASIAASVNGISAIYTKQYSIVLRLTGSFAFTNPDTDPFIPDTQMGALGRTQQAGIEVPKRFTTGLYDIGHVLHQHADGDGWSNGGLAQLQSVCDNFTSGGQINKASAWSGAYTNKGYGWVSLFAHEVGHQFGMRHTFNGTGESCTDAISDVNAVEIGSGTTIMSYNGLCQANNNVPSNGEADNYFHYASTQEMLAYIMDEIPSCAVETNSTNHHPNADVNPCGVVNYKMPKNTPFYLKGSGSDDDGDVIYYAWEQFDEDGPGKPTQGNIGAAAGAKRNTPLFKNIPPSLLNERFFPDALTVASGNGSDPFQALPTIDREINFGFSVRDDKSEGGGLTYQELTVNVETTGPLTLTYPNTNENLMAGDNIDVTWATNGSDNLCTNAEISLSLDGGVTFPIVLADNVPYAAGTLNLDIPGFVNNTTTARIKVGCNDYDCFKFYDISNTNFRIQSICSAPQSIICPSDNLAFDKGDPRLDLVEKSFIGTKVTSFSKRITSSSPIGPSPIRNSNLTGCINKGDTRYTSVDFAVSKSGTYTFNVESDFNGGFGFVTIVQVSTYSETAPCNAFIASSGIDAGANGVSASTVFIANLEECATYRMLFFNYGTKPINTKVGSFSGPGILIEQQATPNADFSYVYVAVKNSTNTISAISQGADFTSLSPGVYTIHGFTYKSGGNTPPNITDMNNYVGQQFNQFYIEGDCFLASLNNFQLEVLGSCALESVFKGSQGVCNPLDNSFTQEIILTYSNPPGTTVKVGNDTYNLSTSPQTIIYTGQADGLNTLLDVYFPEDSDCKYTLNITNPVNCCPFEIGVDAEVRGCEGQPLDVMANPNLGTYLWTDINGVSLGTTSNLTISLPGTYGIAVTSGTGCKKSTSFEASFEPTPTVSIPSDLTICDGVEYLIVANTTATFLEWYKDGILVKSGSEKALLVDTSGLYLVKAGNSTLCQVEDEMVIGVKPSPKPNLGTDKDICEGDDVTLSITDDGSIEWFFNNVLIPNQTGKQLSSSQDGVYKVVVTGSNGCVNEDIVNVNVYALPMVDAGSDQKFCEGKDVVINATSTSQIYVWYKDGVAYPATDLSFVTSTPGSYAIEAANEIGCKVADTVIITRNLLPAVNLGPDKTGCIGSDVQLTGPTAAGLMYQWYFNGLATPGGQTINVTNMGTYALQVTDVNGCSNTDMILVDFKPGLVSV
ncbi:MAG: hypothetical protein IPN29_13620 [Saprospiraceae bacterium]|nr:hypothetical protein [Saprospiraceae bacterium]